MQGLVSRQGAEAHQIVDRAGVHGARRAHEHKGFQPIGAVARDLVAQGLKVDLAQLVHGNAPQGIGAEPGHIKGTRNAAMHLSRGIGDEPGPSGKTMVSNRRAATARTGYDGGDKIGLRRTGEEQAIGALRIAKGLPHQATTCRSSSIGI
jgi:hypothetical protein